MASNFFSHLESYRVQKTIRNPIVFSGVGLHTGQLSTVRLVPAAANHGIIFLRKSPNKALGETFRIPAHYHWVVSTEMATSVGIKGKPQSTIATVEHLLSAIYALGVTNLLIEVSGPEIPILDGSASNYFLGIMQTGLEIQPFTTSVLRILKPIKIYANGTICELLPRHRLRLTTSIEFSHPAIGLQTFALDLTPALFQEQVATARTFGFVRDLERLQSRKLALGADTTNVLAFTDDGILNQKGMRFADECARHKLLDSIGDLALCGSWIEGELVSYRGGHSIHLALLKSLKKFPKCWAVEPSEPLRHAAFSADRYADSEAHAFANAY